MTLKRYASPTMQDLWEPEHRLRLFMCIWIATASALVDAGCLPEATDEQSAKARVFMASQPSPEADEVLAQAAVRERRTGHDVKAALEVLSEYTGYGHYHVGLTGRDVTDTATQMQVIRAERHCSLKAAQLLSELQVLIERWAGQAALGMTHNQPAQITTVGRKLAIYGEQLALALLHNYQEPTVLREMAGPIGTGVDMDQLLRRSSAPRPALTRTGLTELVYGMLMPSLAGLPRLQAQGQIYPRSFDKDAVARCVRIGAALSNLAHMVRLTSGRGLLREGYPPGRVGSSSMPHKRNPSRSERICGLYRVLCGYEQMLAAVAGQQWEEGDVSCSVVQRVALPGAFLALDGMLEQAHVLLSGLELAARPTAEQLALGNPGVLSSLLMQEQALNGDVPREEAYEQTKERIDAPLDEITVRRLAGAQISAAMEQVSTMLAPQMQVYMRKGETIWMHETV